MPEEYYECIDSQRHVDEIEAKEKVNFTHRQFRKIQRKIRQVSPRRHLILFENRKGFISDDNEFNIQSISDGWYYVRLRANYFKCDQFDGLLKCLESEIN